MFRKTTVKTYERKNPATARNVSTMGSVTRENVPPDENVETEWLAMSEPKDVDDTLEYDPFDTTFDRLAKDARVPPIPPPQDSDSSYHDSSSDLGDTSAELSLFKVSIASRKTQKPRRYKKQRNDNAKSNITEKKAKIQKKNKVTNENKVPKVKTLRKGRRKQKIDNLEFSIIEKKNKAQRKNDVINENMQPKVKIRKKVRQKRLVNQDNSPINTANKGKYGNYLTGLKRCTVSLSRINFPLGESLQFLSLNCNNFNTQNKLFDQANTNKAQVLNEESNDNGTATIPNVTHSDNESINVSDQLRFKNPTASSSRMSLLRPRMSVANPIWISSTPIEKRVSMAREKNLRFSSVNGNTLNKVEDTKTPDSVEKIKLQLEPSKPTNSAQLVLNVSIDRLKTIPSNVQTPVLSMSPDPNPSKLMFDDTETGESSGTPFALTFDDTNSDTRNTTASDKIDEAPAINGFKGFPDTNQQNVLKDTKQDSMVNRDLTQDFSTAKNDIAETQTLEDSPFKGFLRNPDGAMEDNANDSSNVRNERDTIQDSVDEERSILPYKKRTYVMDTSMDSPFRGFPTVSQELLKKKWSNITESLYSCNESSVEEKKHSAPASVASITNPFEGFPSDELMHSNKIMNNVMERHNLSDEWSTISEEEEALNIQSLHAQELTNECLSIVQLSSNEDITSIDLRLETANNNETLAPSTSGVTEEFPELGEIIHLDMDDIQNEETVEDSPINEQPDPTEEDVIKMNKELHCQNRMQPVVLLQRLKSPVKRTKKAAIKRKSLRRQMAIDILNSEDEFDDKSVTVTSEQASLNKTRQTLCQPVVVLSRLNDSTRITDRRKKNRIWNLHLNAVSENDEVETVSTFKKSPEEPEIRNASAFEIQEKQTDFSKELSEKNGRSFGINENKEDRVFYLKPGKSWARSLSILNNIRNQDDVEILAVGKGKKWRESVQCVLEMQQQGLIQSCIKKNDCNESRSYERLQWDCAARRTTGYSSQPESRTILPSPSPGRFSRRVSIRVVPDINKLDRLEDTPFLEAYGILSSETRRTLTERPKLIEPRRTLAYNIHSDNDSCDKISRSPTTVTSRDVVLAQCNQQTSLPFDECYPESYLNYCRKIGEGVYGEVFLYDDHEEKIVIKIIPIEGELEVNSERQKRFDEILSEIVIAKELHNLRFADVCNTNSFVEVKNVRCVVGAYPQKLISLWRNYDELKNSENDCPSMFDESQLYIVLELGHGGQDLEAFVFQNATESHALFLQAALALAVAEDSLEFEHRDLHWGNILISRTTDQYVKYKLRNKEISVPSKGVKIAVIDFTLSRMSYQGCSVFNDLALDEDLFSAQGEYQFEIYRLMREKNQNNWQQFEPYSNILWLHYTLDKMITAVRYKKVTTKIHKVGIDKLQDLKDRILNYDSAYNFVTNCDKLVRLQGSRMSNSTLASST